MVIGELPIGSIVRFGRYSMGHLTHTIDIDWIKVSDDNEFISEKVLLGMKFDEVEANWMSNDDYWLSNLRQFMNSDNENWFMPTHQYDKPTDYIHLDGGYTIRMSRYKGLLYHFKDSEFGAFERMEFGDYLRLPKATEIMGGFKYFKRRGARARPVDAYGYLERKNYHEGMFASYFVSDPRTDGCVTEVNRLGKFSSQHPACYSGVRPVCKFKASSEVIKTGENTYEMNLSSAAPVKYFEETQSLDWLLGL